ncbi:MAG: type VI secretion system accessory protein TagJ [Gemmataceae bacterium]
MTPRDALADGRLADAVTAQQQVVADRPGDPAARLFLFELLTLAGRLRAAADQLRAIASDAPDWPRSRRRFLRLLTAEHRRSHRLRRPRFVLPPPPHVRRRRAALDALTVGDVGRAVRLIDRADAVTPAFGGHVDGREFDGLRDADDRFTAVLEGFAGREYVWVPFDQLRRVTLAPAAGVLDAAFRPADVTLADGRRVGLVLPLVYPGSHAADGAFAAGQDTDWPPAGGLACGVGARVLLAGDEELPLGEVRQLDVRVS